MRKSCALVFLLLSFWLGQDAQAGVTVEVVFQDGTGGALTITEGDPGPGCVFGGYGDGSVTTGRCMDIILKSTFDIVALGASATYDSDNGLAVGFMYEWKGPIVGWNRGAPTNWCLPAAGLVDQGGEINSFDCVIDPPVNPPVVPAGTYRIGTLVWDTSGTTSGTETIAAYINPLFDSVSVIVNGDMRILIWPEIEVDDAVLNIVGEPAAVPSMSATAVTVLGVAVLGIGVMGLVIAARRRLH